MIWYQVCKQKWINSPLLLTQVRQLQSIFFIRSQSYRNLIANLSSLISDRMSCSYHEYNHEFTYDHISLFFLFSYRITVLKSAHSVLVAQMIVERLWTDHLRGIFTIWNINKFKICHKFCTPFLTTFWSFTFCRSVLSRDT